MLDHTYSLIILAGLFLMTGYVMLRKGGKKGLQETSSETGGEEYAPESLGAFSMTSFARKVTKAGVPLFHTADSMPSFLDYVSDIQEAYTAVEEPEDITRLLAWYYYAKGAQYL